MSSGWWHTHTEQCGAHYVIDRIPFFQNKNFHWKPRVSSEAQRCTWTYLRERCRKLCLWGSEVWEAESEVKGSKSRMLFLLLCLTWPMTLEKSLLFAAVHLWCVLCSAGTFEQPNPHSYQDKFLDHSLADYTGSTSRLKHKKNPQKTNQKPTKTPKQFSI